MIQIKEKLWVVKTTQKHKTENLAYMTYYAEDKAFEKRKQTGLSWAGRDTTTPQIYDNEPLTGFYIADSVSRWSTSNKLFRVKDPRGFIIEVPTGNIAELLHSTVVKKGYVQEECVWGREGNNHILLPINSGPYKQGKKNVGLLNQSVTATNLREGDKVYIGKDLKTRYLYRGKYKPCWEIKIKRSQSMLDYSYRPIYRRLGTDPVEKTLMYTQKNFKHLFQSVDRYLTQKTSAKCVLISSNNKLDTLPKDLPVGYCDKEIQNYLDSVGIDVPVYKRHYDQNSLYCDIKFVCMIKKD